MRKKLSPSLNLPLSHHPLAGRRLAHPGCRGLPLSAPPCGPVARAPRVQRPSSFRPSLRAGGPRTQGVPMPSSFRPSLRAGGSRTQDAEAFLSPPLPAGRWPAHPGCRGLPLSAPLCGPVARAPRGCRGLPFSAPLCGPVARALRMQRPSSLRPSLRAGGPRTPGAEAFLSPSLSAGRWPAHPGCRGLPLSAPLCGPVTRAPRMQRPSSFRPPCGPVARAPRDSC